MARQPRTFLIQICAALALGAALALVAPRDVRAAVISTDDAIGKTQDRERVKALVARPEVARELAKLGVAPQDIDKRVDAMSDQEVRLLAGRLDALPAGGALSNTDFLLIVIVVILAVVLL